MMKRNMVMIASLMIGICCLSGMSAAAAQNAEQESVREESVESQAGDVGGPEESREPQTGDVNQEEVTESQAEDINQEEVTEPKTEDVNQAESTEPQTEGATQAESTEPQTEDIDQTDSMELQVEDAAQEDMPESRLCSLQIPQKMGVVIDPWEIDGKGQIYSEQYTIQNTGEETGVLTLSFQCRKGENSTAIIRTDKMGLHDDENKSIYIEVIFGETEGKVLGEEGLEYQAELEPGEALEVSFTGEVNENVSESWGNGDVEIEGIYFWNVAEDADAEAEADVDGTEEAPDSEADVDGTEEPLDSEADVDGTEEPPDSEAGDVDGIEGEPAVSGNDWPGNGGANSTERTDPSAAEEPVEDSDGQDGEVKDNEDEPQDAEGTENSESLNEDNSGDADDSRSGMEDIEPAGGEESGSSNGQDNGESVPKESGELSASEDDDVKDETEVKPEDGNGSLPMESSTDKTEPETEEPAEDLSGGAKEVRQADAGDEDMPGTDSQKTDQNLKMNDVDDGREE